ncbi:hypothetical protein SAMN05518849_13913 [Sphingobium sp. AP50]|nr:hypothetical protein SAMN05518849_13913 [Sphingobium sp. AP50]
MFFNSRNGQRHLLRYFQHRFFVDAAKNEDTAALGGQRLDDRLDLTQRFAGMQLGFDIILATQQFQVGDGFEAHHLVAARGVDHQVACDGEQIGSTRRHIFPVFRGIGASQYLGDHVFQFMRGWQYAAEATPQRGFLWQDDRFEPFQFSANPLHVDPLICQPRLSNILFSVTFQSWMQGSVQPLRGPKFVPLIKMFHLA